MADGWIIKRNDQKYGPFTSTQLVEMAKKGQVLPLDWVARGEGGQWMPASQVKGLFAAPAAAPSSLPPASVATPLPASVPSQRWGKLLGVVSARIFRPVIGMIVVIGLGLLTSFFCGSLTLFLLSFIHIAAAVACVVLAVRLQKFLYAPLSALLTMAVWGWYCFCAVPIAIAILGLLAGIAIGGWALLTFRLPDVKALFADAGKPGPLDSFGTPVLAGMAGGLLVVILGIGGVLYMVNRDTTKTSSTSSGGDIAGRGQAKERATKSRSGGSKSGRPVLEDLIAIMGKPDESWSNATNPYIELHAWKQGADEYEAVTTLGSRDSDDKFVVQTYEGLTREKLEMIRESVTK